MLHNGVELVLVGGQCSARYTPLIVMTHRLSTGLPTLQKGCEF